MLARLDSDRSRTLLLLAGLMASALALDLWQTAARQAAGTAWFEAPVCLVSRPLQVALTGTIRFAEQEWQSALAAHKLARENKGLRARVAELENRVSTLTEERLAAQRVTRLAYAPGSSGRRCVARAIGFGGNGRATLLTVDAGGARGVRQQDIALAVAGVVGQVVAVTADSARVLPITEPGSAVAVRLQRPRELGTLNGSGGWQCEIAHLDPQADVRPGDVVITSGLGGIFPAGLLVGQVTKVRSDRKTPGRIAEVRPSAEMRRIEEMVLLSPR